MDGFPMRGSLPGLRPHVVSLEGTGASAPTLVYGQGVTITRTSEGLYKVTWADNPGTFVTWTWACGGATPSAMAGHTVTRDTMSTSSPWTMEFLLNEADDSIDDLEDNEFIDLILWFAD
jgi:hypothetical protein